MISKLSYTTGSHALLANLIEQHPERRLVMAASPVENDHYALFDLSGQASIFHSPIELTTLAAGGTLTPFGPVIHIESFSLDKDRRDLLRKRGHNLLNQLEGFPGFNGGLMTSNDANSTTTVFVTTWQEASAISKWHDSDVYSPIRQYTTPGPENTYFHLDFLVE